MEFDRIASRHKNAIYRQLVRMCGNHDDAEDILVEALLNAYRKMHTLRDEQAFRAWLEIIATRACGRLKRKEALRQLLPLDFVESAGIELASQEVPADLDLYAKDLKRCVHQALLKLPEPYREVYLSRDIEGLSGEETAMRLGISLAATKSRLHRARKIVRESIDLALCLA